MTQTTADLSVLSRARQRAAPPEAVHAAQSGADARAVPMPRARWKTRVLLPAAIFVATVATLLIAAGGALWPATPVQVVPVMVKAGEQAAGKVIVQAPGWVEADPFPTAVSALADGIVSDVLVLEGQPVEAGQVVARLIDIDAKLALARAEAALQQARAELNVADAELKAAQREWDNPVELTRKVAFAEAELAEKQAELERWPAEVAAEEALAQYKEAEYLRVKPLFEGGQASSIEFVRVQKEFENQKALAESMRAKRPVIEAQIRALEAEGVAARENLRLRIAETRMLESAKANVARMQASVAVAQAMRDEAQLRLERMEVKSPTAGIVMTRLAEPGSKLMIASDEMRSNQVVRLYSPDKLQVRVDVPLADASKVGIGQKAEVVVEVLPERTFQGHVTRIVNEADVQKNTLQVKVAIENPSAEIKPEMLARARFIANPDARPDAQVQRLLLPESVVLQHAGNKTVWLADSARNRAEMRMVTPGRAVDGWVEIESGVQAGDRAIVNAPASLSDGTRIQIVGEVAGDNLSSAKGSTHGTH